MDRSQNFFAGIPGDIIQSMALRLEPQQLRDYCQDYPEFETFICKNEIFPRLWLESRSSYAQEMVTNNFHGDYKLAFDTIIHYLLQPDRLILWTILRYSLDKFPGLPELVNKSLPVAQKAHLPAEVRDITIGFQDSAFLLGNREISFLENLLTKYSFGAGYLDPNKLKNMCETNLRRTGAPILPATLDYFRRKFYVTPRVITISRLEQIDYDQATHWAELSQAIVNNNLTDVITIIAQNFEMFKYQFDLFVNLIFETDSLNLYQALLLSKAILNYPLFRPWYDAFNRNYSPIQVWIHTTTTLYAPKIANFLAGFLIEPIPKVVISSDFQTQLTFNGPETLSWRDLQSLITIPSVTNINIYYPVLDKLEFNNNVLADFFSQNEFNAKQDVTTPISIVLLSHHVDNLINFYQHFSTRFTPADLKTAIVNLITKHGKVTDPEFVKNEHHWLKFVKYATNFDYLDQAAVKQLDGFLTVDLNFGENEPNSFNLYMHYLHYLVNTDNDRELQDRIFEIIPELSNENGYPVDDQGYVTIPARTGYQLLNIYKPPYVDYPRFAFAFLETFEIGRFKNYLLIPPGVTTKLLVDLNQTISRKIYEWKGMILNITGLTQVGYLERNYNLTRDQ